MVWVYTVFLEFPNTPLVDLLFSLSILAFRLQEEEALLSEMDVTGQAFEDMQEQNGRLLQQLREKDDANFKLMSERIKANQIHKLLREEKDELGEQVLGLKSQVWQLQCSACGWGWRGCALLLRLPILRWMPSC